VSAATPVARPCGLLRTAQGQRIALGVLTCLTFAPAGAQTYPTKPIRAVTDAAGGGNDFTARMVSPVAAELGQPWVVDNRGGAGGLISAEIVAKAAPDGYTLLIHASNIWTIPLLQRDPPYEFSRTFAPVVWVSRAPNTLVVHPSVAATSVQELIDLARAQPGRLNYGSGGNAATTHIAAELFKSMAKVDIVRVQYKGTGPAINDLLGGRLQLMFTTASAAAPHIKSGRLRALAVTSAEPSPLAPGLPTVAASGLPGYESGSIYGVFAPVRTPPAIIERLNRAIVKVVTAPGAKERFLASGLEAVGSTPAEFAAVIKRDVARLTKVVAEAGLKEP